MKRILSTLLIAACGLASAATLSPIQLLNPAGSTAGQAIVSTGAGTAPAWGTITAGSLSPVGANTVIANVTASSAAPLAVALPSCSTANSALKYTTSTGLSCGTAFALTSGNLSQFAATTSAQLLGVLSDETGTGSAVFSASPSLTGTISAAAITASGAITPSQTVGIVGTTTNNNANSGAVGEFLSVTVLAGSAVSLTNGVTANVTSLPLTAGDWDVWAQICFGAGGTTNTTGWVGALSTTSATIPTVPNGGAAISLPTNTTGGTTCLPVGQQRVTIASGTTIFLVANASFTVSTNAAYGFIGARRRR